jgi:low affinity Fe/Cu permease
MIYRFFENFARWTTIWTGSTVAFIMALGLIALWFATGPLFEFSVNWQLLVNSGTTIATFLMVFLIQRTQNKDSLTLQMKLNEVIASIQGASNRLLNIEDLSEEEIHLLQRRYKRLAEKADLEDDGPLKPHSVEEIHPSTVRRR